MSRKHWVGILLLCLCSIPHAQAQATLLIGEPYSYDRVFAGTGHAAIYFSHICATSPVVLRPCVAGETGIVLSRYWGVAGYDWIAIPLIPFLYAVEKQGDVPLFADNKLLAFLRDRYRRDHLESLAPDRPDGRTPAGTWDELIGASYIRTFYAFEIETSPEQDAKLIQWLNARPNRQHWNLVRSNCADFAREILSFYYPHSVHRSIFGDLGITTPKQLAQTLSKYSHRHPELRASSYVIPQVPGTVPRSKSVHGVLESVVTAKKYMLPLFVWHPYVAGTLVAGYFGHRHFNPSKNALILDSNRNMGAFMTHVDRRAFRERFDGLIRSVSSADKPLKDSAWPPPHDTRQPALDASVGPIVHVRVDDEVTAVGVSRANILSFPVGADFATALVKARLRQELGSSAHKAASNDVEADLGLLQQLLALQSKQVATTAGSGGESRTQSASAQLH